MKSPRSHLIIFIALGSFLVVVLGWAFKLWAANRELTARSPLPPIIFQQANVQNSFLRAEGATSGDIFSDEKERLIEGQKDFAVVDLQAMELALYGSGKPIKTFKILSKGMDGSWWETPTGIYTALYKESNHFSSIGKVWMPWSIQFYGNFFIHGWPYRSDGTPVPQSYSGGCVRLSTEDAKEVFYFVKRDMPILVHEIEPSVVAKPVLQPISNDIGAPKILANAVLAADLETGDVILNKNADEILPVASLAKLMTATVAGEMIYLGRTIEIRRDMLKDPIQSYALEVGNRYQVFDLLYPLLMQSSNGASRALAAFLGNDYFVEQMNKKAKTLGMSDTRFVDPAGIGDGNVSSLADFGKLARYIFEKRRFIFDITRGRGYDVFGDSNLAKIDNFNEFYSEGNLVGLKNGKTVGAGETLLGIWKMRDGQDFERVIMVGILGSESRVSDAQAVRIWLESKFGLR